MERPCSVVLGGLQQRYVPHGQVDCQPDWGANERGIDCRYHGLELGLVVVVDAAP